MNVQSFNPDYVHSYGGKSLELTTGRQNQKHPQPALQKTSNGVLNCHAYQLS